MIVSKAGNRFCCKKKRKYKGKRIQAVKKRFHNKEETTKQRKKQMYLENVTLKSTYQKAKYQKNSEVHPLLHEKCKYHENLENKMKY